MINKIEFQTNYYANPDGSGRRVEQIAIHIMDMWFYKDINCHRDEYLAKRLADENDVELFDMREGANAPEPLTPEEAREFDESFRVFADMPVGINKVLK